MPHPDGVISVQYEVSGSSLNAVIVLPEKITGTFIWKGATKNLTSGKNVIKL